MTFYPRAIAEQAFKMASAEAALFELRMRLRTGAIPATRALPIDSKLSCVLDALLKHYRSVLSAPEVIIIEKACALRNEFDEATRVFREAMSILDRLSESKE